MKSDHKHPHSITISPCGFEATVDTTNMDQEIEEPAIEKSEIGTKYKATCPLCDHKQWQKLSGKHGGWSQCLGCKMLGSTSNKKC